MSDVLSICLNRWGGHWFIFRFLVLWHIFPILYFSLCSLFISKERQIASCTVGGILAGKSSSIPVSYLPETPEPRDWERTKHVARLLTVGRAASASEWVALGPASMLWSEASMTDVLEAGERGAHLRRWKSWGNARAMVTGVDSAAGWGPYWFC